MASLFLVQAKLQAMNAIIVSGNTYKLAFFNSSYTTTTATYGTTNEVTGTGWSAGGATLSGLSTSSSGSTAWGDFADVSVSTVTVTGVRFLVLYDATDNNEVRAVYDLGSDYAATAGTVAITWPTADATNAMIRFG